MGEVIRRTRNGRFLGYYLRFYECGRRRIIASKQTSHAEARRMLLEIEARVARGERGIVERPVHRLTMSELADRFLAEYDRPRLKNALKYRAQTRSVIRKALAWLGKLSVDQIKPADVVRMRDAIRRTHAPGTVNSTMDRLSVVFSWGVKQGLAPANPCRSIERTRAEGALDFWSKEEVQQLLDAAEAHQKTLSEKMRYLGVALAVHTGLRKGELLGLRWIDVDLEAQRLTVARSYVTTPKGGKTRHLRLPSALVPILKEWKERCPLSTGGTILPIGRTETKTANKNTMLGLDTLMDELGLRKVRHPWHMLRHTFASHFVMSGGNILALQKILGHSDLKMTMIYAHLAPDYLGQEMERVSYARTGPHPPKLPIPRP